MRRLQEGAGAERDRVPQIVYTRRRRRQPIARNAGIQPAASADRSAQPVPQSPSVRNPLIVGQRRFEGFDELWKVVGHDLPKNIEIDFVIAMDQPISQADDLWPGHVRDARTLVFWNTVGRFANNLQQAHKCEVELPVGVQVCARRPLAIPTASCACSSIWRT